MKRNKKAILLALVTSLSLSGCSIRTVSPYEKDEYEILETKTFDLPMVECTPSINIEYTNIVETMPSPIQTLEETPDVLPTPEPTAIPTPEPTAIPTPEPTAIPTPEPTIVPTTEVALTPIIDNRDSFNQINWYAYITNTCPIYDSYKEDKLELTYIEQYQKVFVVSSNDEYFNVITENGNIGYVSINNIELLPENYVEVDLSSQNVKVFDDYEEVLNCDVVTGLPGNDTNEGYTEILEKTYDRPLVGPTWNVDVNYFFPFNYSEEGFHDASWRGEFGGDIYTYNGSHGCVNMRENDIVVMDEHIEIGTKVLVHK